jgi:hypothetical protein
MICSSNVFFINNPDPNPDPKLRLKLDPDTDPKERKKIRIHLGLAMSHWYLQYAMEVHPTVMQAYPRNAEAHPGTRQAYPKTMKAHTGVLRAHPGAIMEVEPWAWRLKLELPYRESCWGSF